MKWFVAVFALHLAYAASVTAADPPVSADQFIVVQVDDAEVPTRLLVTIDGKPLRQIWDAYFERLFEFLDRDGDHLLNAAEAARVPSAAWLKTQWRGDFDNVTTPFVSWQEIDPAPKDGRLTAAELAAYYRRAGLGSADVQPGKSSAALDARSTRQLFEQIAGGPDADWDAAKLATAAEKLRRYDFNDDERWSAAELKSWGQSKAGNDKTVSEKQSVPPLQLSAERKGPMLKVNLRTEGDMAGDISAAKRITADSIDWTTAAAGVRAEAMTVDGKGALVRIRVATGQGEAAFRSACLSLLQQFEIDDLDRSQSLDAAEAKKSPLSESFQPLLAVADRNTDGKLTVAELQKYLDLQAVAAGQHLILVIADHGVPLFEMLDADEDGAISLRELRTAWSRLAASSARDPKARLTWNDLPRKYEWTFSLGLPKPVQVQRTAPATDHDPAPGWFAKMDRNGDGDLSRREFLGEAAEFLRLDKDSDDLISPAEASRGFLVPK